MHTLMRIHNGATMGNVWRQMSECCYGSREAVSMLLKVCHKATYAIIMNISPSVLYMALPLYRVKAVIV